jgi:hypothetical protein
MAATEVLILTPGRGPCPGRLSGCDVDLTNVTDEPFKRTLTFPVAGGNLADKAAIGFEPTTPRRIAVRLVLSSLAMVVEDQI